MAPVHVQLEPSRDWQEVIETALRTCHVLVAHETPGFKESNWTDQEVGWVLGRGIPAIPVNAALHQIGEVAVEEPAVGVLQLADL